MWGGCQEGGSAWAGRAQSRVCDAGLSVAWVLVLPKKALGSLRPLLNLSGPQGPHRQCRVYSIDCSYLNSWALEEGGRRLRKWEFFGKGKGYLSAKDAHQSTLSPAVANCHRGFGAPHPPTPSPLCLAGGCAHPWLLQGQAAEVGHLYPSLESHPPPDTEIPERLRPFWGRGLHLMTN